MTRLLQINRFAPETIKNNHNDRMPRPANQTALEYFFEPFRKKTIGIHQSFPTPFGEKRMVYADWTATGKAYQPIEDCMQQEVLPFLGNTHTGSTITGTLMSKAYADAKRITRQHVHADKDDVLVFCGSGMTGAVNKLQRILGIRVHERTNDYAIGRGEMAIDETLRPVVFITHMEHHSNQISWLETIADVEIIEPAANGNVDLKSLAQLLARYSNRKNKIAAVTACSNVTGIQPPIHAIAKLLHAHGGLCFVDFAAAAPYVNINMHPAEPGAHLDAIYFSPHKFLGGAGTPGVLVFNKRIYQNRVPDHPGGGTVEYSNPWKLHEYVNDIEQREDGGTPPFLQAIKVAMCIRLKEQMGVENMLAREQEILRILYARFARIQNITVLAGNIKRRLGIISFLVNGAHHNLVAKLLNDRFGIQARAGCSCAATYGHLLLGISKNTSLAMLNRIRSGDQSCKPGWVRLSVHPTLSNADIHFIMDGVEALAAQFPEWSKDYRYEPETNEFAFKGFNAVVEERTDNWFNVQHWK